MSDITNTSSWFSEHYYAHKALRGNEASLQSARLSDILARFVDQSTRPELGVGKTSNLLGVMTEIASAGILRVLTYPNYKLRIATEIEDSVGADLIVYDGRPKRPEFAIDVKKGKAIGPAKSKALQMPVISLSFPEEQTGIIGLIDRLGAGEMVEPNNYYAQQGVEGLRETGMLGCLQDTSGWILRDRMFTRSNGSLSRPTQFLKQIISS